ncbi:hypothetical protein HDV05_003111 [Chytridiales sp. JEL 0842]|nr:hypothetical protein HDV05_003111 [Chytridiales sp. JEL 0842]
MTMELEISDALMTAAAAADIPAMETVLEESPLSLYYRDPVTGASPLHLAAKTGSIEALQTLISAGHEWNAVDLEHKTAAEYGVDAGHQKVWDFLLAEGIRVEMILSILGKQGNDNDEEEENEEVEMGVDGEEKVEVVVGSSEVQGEESQEQEVEEEEEEEETSNTKKPSNADYLAMPLTFSEGRLLDKENNGVMMGWEAPLMKRHADVIAPTECLDVLNVGFGLGLIDTYLQERRPKTHTIIEAHPDVYAKMIADGWDKKEGVRILFGRWQDVIHDLETYDGIFFDTFGEYYEDLKEFHDLLPNILREDGIYSYFNGLAGSNIFFHAVSCAIAEADLRDMGLKTEMEDIQMAELGDEHPEYPMLTWANLLLTILAGFATTAVTGYLITFGLYHLIREHNHKTTLSRFHRRRKSIIDALNIADAAEKELQATLCFVLEEIGRESNPPSPLDFGSEKSRKRSQSCTLHVQFHNPTSLHIRSSSVPIFPVKSATLKAPPSPPLAGPISVQIKTSKLSARPPSPSAPKWSSKAGRSSSMPDCSPSANGTQTTLFTFLLPLACATGDNNQRKSKKPTSPTSQSKASRLLSSSLHQRLREAQAQAARVLQTLDTLKTSAMEKEAVSTLGIHRAPHVNIYSKSNSTFKLLSEVSLDAILYGLLSSILPPPFNRSTTKLTSTKASLTALSNLFVTDVDRMDAVTFAAIQEASTACEARRQALSKRIRCLAEELEALKPTRSNLNFSQ